MTQTQLERSIAAATGESLATIRRRGFSMVDMPATAELYDAVVPQMVDWDELDANRTGVLPARSQRRQVGV